MGATHLSLHYHVVFSTKGRAGLITPDVRGRIHEYIGGAVRGNRCVSPAVGGTADHVHVLFGLRAEHRLSDVMREVKSESSLWIHRELRMPLFAWQEGYGGFTVSASHVETVRRYIMRQEEHHRVRTFQEEYVAMLQRGLVEYDERYLW